MNLPTCSREARARRAAPSCQPSLLSSDAMAAHVSAAILWLLTMMTQVLAKGFRADILRRPALLCAVLATRSTSSGSRYFSGGLSAWECG